MNFTPGLFPADWFYAAFVPLLGLWVWSVRTAPWRRLADGGQLNVWLGLIVVLVLLWSLKAGVRPGLNFHLLGATAFALMFGPQMAIVGLSVVLAAVMLNTEPAWSTYALNALMTVAVPVFVAYAIFRAVDRYLPNHFFIYIFVAAFFGAALTVAITGAAATLLLYVSGVYAGDYLMSQYLPYFMLLAFSEAALTGMCMTILVVYRPHWVGTFDDKRYLLNK